MIFCKSFLWLTFKVLPLVQTIYACGMDTQSATVLTLSICTIFKFISELISELSSELSGELSSELSGELSGELSSKLGSI